MKITGGFRRSAGHLSPMRHCKETQDLSTNRLTILFFALFTITLTACDPGVKYNKVVQNDSDFDLMLYIYPESIVGDGAFYEFDSLQINSHSKASIYEVSGLGQTFEYEDCNTYADSIFAKVSGNDTLYLNINLNDRSQWIFTVLDKSFKQGGTCECRVMITSDMIK
jgi:hypothetical protein